MKESAKFTVSPVDVDVLGLDPHAHDPNQELQGWTTPPDATRKRPRAAARLQTQ